MPSTQAKVTVSGIDSDNTTLLQQTHLYHTTSQINHSFNPLNQQDMDTILQKLIDNQLVQQKDSLIFQEILVKNQDLPEEINPYLYGLFQYEFGKMTGNYHIELHLILAPEMKLNPEEQVENKKNLLTYLTQLQNAGFVETTNVQKIQAAINDGTITHTGVLLLYLIEQSITEH